MKIKKQFKGESTFKKISMEDFIKWTEGRGFYKKGTALTTLKENKEIQTDIAIFKI
jgi:hypothetical protein